MGPSVIPLAIIALLMAVDLYGQESVCDLFTDLKAADGRHLTITGELLISKGLTALGAADCDHRYKSPVVSGSRAMHLWPTALNLRPEPTVPAEKIQQIENAAAEADRLRSEGKTVNASASFSGHLRVVAVGDDFPAELIFDSYENLSVKALPDPGELPVIPICKLFENLGAWKGKRIAVRGEFVGTDEGAWITGRCKGSFYTGEYRWPVTLDYAGPAYLSNATAFLSWPKQSSLPPAGGLQYEGRYNVVYTATYVGLLRMRNEYTAVCRESGDYITNGFGHLNGAAAELIVEAVRDSEITPRAPSTDIDDAGEEQKCTPLNLAALCSSASSLLRAASLGCVDKARELVMKEGIDSKAGSESAALRVAIRTGNETLVKFLVESGAPVNPIKTLVFSPIGEAASARKISILKLLLSAGANVDAPDHQGATYLAGYGFFDTRVTNILLDAGANPNARDKDGATALMKSANYGYEDAVRLLIDHKADVDLKDNNGRTALMHAAAGKYIDAIPLLLKAGADLYVRDQNNDTALDIARKSANYFAVELLSAAMKGDR
jgi:hypothetical protein